MSLLKKRVMSPFINYLCVVFSSFHLLQHTLLLPRKKVKLFSLHHTSISSLILFYSITLLVHSTYSWQFLCYFFFIFSCWYIGGRQHPYIHICGCQIHDIAKICFIHILYHLHCLFEKQRMLLCIDYILVWLVSSWCSVTDNIIS